MSRLTQVFWSHDITSESDVSSGRIQTDSLQQILNCLPPKYFSRSGHVPVRQTASVDSRCSGSKHSFKPQPSTLCWVASEQERAENLSKLKCSYYDVHGTLWCQLSDGGPRVAVHAGSGPVDGGDGDVRLQLVHPLAQRPLGPAVRDGHVPKGRLATGTRRKSI